MNRPRAAFSIAALGMVCVVVWVLATTNESAFKSTPPRVVDVDRQQASSPAAAVSRTAAVIPAKRKELTGPTLRSAIDGPPVYGSFVIRAIHGLTKKPWPNVEVRGRDLLSRVPTAQGNRRWMPPPGIARSFEQHVATIGTPWSKTDKKGELRIPCRRVPLAITTSAIVDGVSWRAFLELSIQGASSKDHRFDLVLWPEQSALFEFVDPDGRPLPGLEVSMHFGIERSLSSNSRLGSWETKTDALGHVRIEALEQLLRGPEATTGGLFLTAKNYDVEQRRQGIRHPRDRVVLSVKDRMLGDDQEFVRRFELPACARVRARIQDRSDAEIDRVLLSFWTRNNRRRGSYTRREAGQPPNRQISLDDSRPQDRNRLARPRESLTPWVWVFADREFELSARAGGAEAAVLATLKPGEARTIDLRLGDPDPGFVIVGRLLDRDGKPVPDANLRLLSEFIVQDPLTSSDSGRKKPFVPNPRYAAQTQTDADGRFEVFHRGDVTPPTPSHLFVMERPGWTWADNPINMVSLGEQPALQLGRTDLGDVQLQAWTHICSGRVDSDAPLPAGSCTCISTRSAIQWCCGMARGSASGLTRNLPQRWKHHRRSFRASRRPPRLAN